MNIRSNPDTTLPAVTTGPLPASRKIWVTPDEAPDVRVPLREIILSEGAGEPNLPVYDTSGPYTDPDVTIDVNAGLKRARIEWVKERGLQPIEAPQTRRGPHGLEQLQVTADGDPEKEKFYRTHYAPVDLSGPPAPDIVDRFDSQRDGFLQHGVVYRPLFLGHPNETPADGVERHPAELARNETGDFL